MRFPFTCPECRHESPVPKALAGSHGKCPHCGAVVRLVSPDSVYRVRDEPIMAVPASAPQPVPASAPKPVRIELPAPAPPAADSSPPKRGIGGIVLFVAVVILCLPICAGGGFSFYWIVIREPVSRETVLARDRADTKTADEKRDEVQPRPQRDNGGEARVDVARKRLLSGSAWLISGDGRRAAVGSAAVVHRDLRLLVANYHVVNQFESVVAVFPAYDGGKLITQAQPYFDAAAEKGQAARVVVSDPKRDLVVLQLKQLPNGFGPIKLAAESPEAGQSVKSLGAAAQLAGFGMEDGMLWRIASTKVRRVVQHQHTYKNGQTVTAQIIEMPAPAEPTDFGGPIVDERGRLLGITCGIGDADAEQSFAVDIHEVRSMLADYFKKIGRRWNDDEADSSGGAPALEIDEDNPLPSYWINQVLRKAHGEDL